MEFFGADVIKVVIQTDNDADFIGMKDVKKETPWVCVPRMGGVRNATVVLDDLDSDAYWLLSGKEGYFPQYANTMPYVRPPYKKC
ncbi:MAG: hypothetical protein ACUVUH_02945 [bacterium]